MTDSDRIQNFRDFWPFYVGEHRSPVNRGLHYVGTGAAVTLALYATFAQQPLFGLLAVFCGYGFAWVGHFRVEHNRPATFTYPGWSLLGDFKMLFYFLTGRMGREVTRLYGSRHPSEDAPLLLESQNQRAA